MMKSHSKFSIVLLAAIALFSTGCLEKKSNKKSTSSTSSTFTNPTATWPPYVTPTPDPTQNPPPPGQHADLNGSVLVTVDCTTIKQGGGLSQYCRQIPTVVSKGCGNIGQNGTCATPISWNSVNWPGNVELDTDSELNIRVIPRSAPSQGTTTTNGGGNCGYIGMPYTLLSMKVQIRSSAGAGVYSSFTFDKIPVDKPSYPKNFSIPGNQNGPVVVEVTDLKWDCPQAGNCGTDPTRPMQAVWHTECVSFDLQFSTDNTRSWDRPIIY